MFQVTRLQDGIYEIPAEDFIYVGDAAEGARIRAAKAGAVTPIPVNCFLLRGQGGEVILVDAGTGTAWGPGLGHARAALAAEGIAPEAVDRILVTHVHGDHVLGLFDGEAAYFPRARIALPAAELDYLTDPAARAAASAESGSVFDIADRLLRLYDGRIDRLAGETAAPGISALPLPGHTPGHTGYRLETPEGGLLLWGDVLHLADAQPRDPRLALTYDADADQALESRRAALALALREGLKVGGGHLPGLFQLRPEGEAYRLER